MTGLLGAALAGIAFAGGVVLVVVGTVGTERRAGPPSRLQRAIRRAWVGEGLSPRQRQTRRSIALAALTATIAVWLYTGIPVAGLLTGLAAVGVPWLYSAGQHEQYAIGRLEALEVWTRRLTDLVRTGMGLNQAMIASTRDAPDAIAGELAELAAQLRANVEPTVALTRFADAIGDASADEVIVSLMLHVADRGPRLTDVLDKISESIAMEVSQRRQVWASRAEPRLTTWVMTGVYLAVMAFLFANRTYSKPFATLLGQLVLVICAVVFVLLLTWLRRLSRTRPAPRLLTNTAAAQGGAQ